MRELLQKIGTAEIRDITQLDLLCNIVKEYYTNNKRHKYSEVSAYLMEADDIEYLLENLRRIQSRLGEYPEDELISIKVFKLIDHITLELNRIKYNFKNFNEMNLHTMNAALTNAAKAVDSAMTELRKEQSQKIDLEVKEFREETNSLKGKVEDSYSQFVSILGIFSAVVLVFFGGMTAFGELFANMHSIGRFKLIFTAAFVGLIIFNMVFMFLYVLAKLLNREIAASTTAEAAGKHALTRWIKRIWGRYPYLLLFNSAMFMIMLISFAAWYGVTYYGWRC